MKTHEDYLAAADPAVRPRLQRLRELAHQEVPGSSERISYQLMALHKGRVFLYFGAFKKHIGVYPPVTEDPELIALLAPYRGPKGNLQLPHDQPLPEALLIRVIRALAAQYARAR